MLVKLFNVNSFPFMLMSYVPVNVRAKFNFLLAIGTCKFVIFTALEFNVRPKTTPIHVSSGTLRTFILLIYIYFPNIFFSLLSIHGHWILVVVDFLVSFFASYRPLSFPNIHHWWILIISIETIIVTNDCVRKIHFLFIFYRNVSCNKNDIFKLVINKPKIVLFLIGEQINWEIS